MTSDCRNNLCLYAFRQYSTLTVQPSHWQCKNTLKNQDARSRRYSNYTYCTAWLPRSQTKNCIWKKSRWEVASPIQLSFQIKIIIITEAHIRSHNQSYPPIGNTVLQILALQKQYFPAFTWSRTQVCNKIKYLEKVEMFQGGTLPL